MRVLWRDDIATYRGDFVNFEAVKSRPKPAQRGGVPIIVGGSSGAAARRAGRLGDGFFPLSLPPEELGPVVRLMHEAALEAGRDPDSIEITANATKHLDVAKRYADLGATRLVASARDRTDLDSVEAMLGDLNDQVMSKLS